MVQGLKEYRDRVAAEAARREEASRPKIQRLLLLKDGDSAIVRFAQEIDVDAAGYSEKQGIGGTSVEHTCGASKKEGWKNRARCSIDSQGSCFPCEKATDYSVEWADRSGWKQKTKFYINLVGGEPEERPNPKNADKSVWVTTDVNRTSGDGTVYLLEQSTHNGIYDALSDYFLEEEVSGNTITDKFFKISRKGSDYNNTSYNITPLKEVPAKAKSLDDFELFDIDEDAITEVPYAQQEAFYYRGITVEAAASEPVGAGTSAGTADGW